MDFKEELSKFRNRFFVRQQKTLKVDIEDVDLDAKVDGFIDWYYENMVKGNSTDVGEYRKPIELRNFIEKMAVCYELRYPDREIYEKMSSESQIGTKENLEIDNDFINSLSQEDRNMFQTSNSERLLYVGKAYIVLDINGVIEKSDGFGAYSDFKVKDDELIGMDIKDAIKLLKDKEVILPSDNELEKADNDFNKTIYLREGMLDSIMYRIIERGGNRIGPRRAFLFAEEFGRNINVPMRYGVDYSDPYLSNFVKEYMNAGGNEYLMCYVNYFSRTATTVQLDVVSIQNLRKTGVIDSVITEEPKIFIKESNELELQRKKLSKRNIK